MTLPHSVAVIGGGFSGVALVMQLVRAGYAGQIYLFEKNSEIGKGVAYSTNSLNHLLNVPAQLMSAFSDDPDSFVRWLKLNTNHSFEYAFVPRKLYGQYLQNIFSEHSSRAVKPIEVLHDSVEECRAVKDCWALRTKRSEYLVGCIILATGHMEPRAPVRVLESLERAGSFVSNPWKGEISANLDSSKSILIIGSGLSAVDVTLDLVDSNFKGKIHLLSRHKLLPQAHTQGIVPNSTGIKLPLKKTARTLLRAVRNEIELRSNDWRLVLDALRSDTPAIWQELGNKEQKRFLRHLRHFWDVHRHKVAPEVGKKFYELVEVGRVSLHGGRIVSVESVNEGIDVKYIANDTHCSEHLVVQRVYNCTGSTDLVGSNKTGIIGQLLRDGYCRVDQLGIGLDVDLKGRALHSCGVAHNNLFVIGPLRKGVLWESTAVRELRTQAQDIAKMITNTQSA